MITPDCPRCGAYALLAPDVLEKDPIEWICQICRFEVQFSLSGKPVRPPIKPTTLRALRKKDRGR